MRWTVAGVQVPYKVADINENGLFMIIDRPVEIGALMQIVIDLPSGPLKACVTARYFGTSQSGRGIGAELFVLADADRDRWAAFYKQTQKAVLADAIALDAYDFEEVTEQTAVVR